MDYKFIQENGKNILKLNILSKKICTYDCIFCPIGRGIRTDEIQQFNNAYDIIQKLETIMDNNIVDLIFINSAGEALLHSGIKEIIKFLKSKNTKVRLLSNGYILNRYKEIANLCDEIVGEIKTVKDIDFQKFQRPVENYSIDGLIQNMAEFNKQYKGKFILNITILNTLNNDEESLNKIRNAINKIKPDKVIIEKEEDKRFVKKYGIEKSELDIISKKLLA